MTGTHERPKRDAIDEVCARLVQGESNVLELALHLLASWVRAPLRDRWGVKQSCLLGCIASLLYLAWAFIHDGPASFSLRQEVYHAEFLGVVVFAWIAVQDIRRALRLL